MASVQHPGNPLQPLGHGRRRNEKGGKNTNSAHMTVPLGPGITVGNVAEAVNGLPDPGKGLRIHLSPGS